MSYAIMVAIEEIKKNIDKNIEKENGASVRQ
jgi:hypothetical protein